MQTMHNKFYNLLSKWRFYVSLQFLFIALLNIIGHVRAESSIHRIFESHFVETVMFFVVTIIAFPSGILALLSLGANPAHVFGQLIFFIIPAIYYPLFIYTLWYIAHQRKNWRKYALALLIFMLLSFGGCSTYIEFGVMT